MQAKRRFFGVVLVFLALFVFTYLLKLNLNNNEGLQISSTIRRHDIESDLTNRKHMKMLTSFLQLIENLSKQVNTLKKTFVRNTQDLVNSTQKKDIYIDILNHGEQTQCKHVNLLIMISSHITHDDRRNVIRSTWGNQTLWQTYTKQHNFTFGFLFLVGMDDNNETLTKQLFQESKTYGDLLIEHLTESFYSLSYKVMIGFQYVDDQCSFDYLLKGDDDIFVNIYNMVNFLRESYIPDKDLYVGHMMTISEVMRNGRYGVSRDEYIRDYYPRYCSGGGFILSRDVVRRIIPHYNWINPLKIDDAYMGQLVLKAGVDAWHDSRFRMYEDSCTFSQDTLVMHAWKNQAVNPICATDLNSMAYKLQFKT